MAGSAGIIIEVLHVAKAVHDQAQKTKYLKSFSGNLGKHAAIIEKLLENEDLRKEIERGNDAELEQALQVILRTLQEGVQPYVSALSEEGEAAKVKIFLQAGSYTEKYERLTGILDGAIDILNMALGIEAALTVDKIAEENKAVQQELEEARAYVEEISEQIERDGEDISSIKDYLGKLNEGMEKLQDKLHQPSEGSIKINREFYYESAISDIKKGIAITGIGKDDHLSVDDISKLQINVPVGQKSYIKSAVANQPGSIAAVLPVENKEALDTILGFLSEQQSSSGFQSDFFGKSKKKKKGKGKEEVKDKGILCEKTEEGKFRVNISYSRLKLTPEQAKMIQSTLKGDHGEGAYAYISSSGLDRRGNITWLLFEDEEATNNLIKVLKVNISKLKQEASVQREESPSPKH